MDMLNPNNNLPAKTYVYVLWMELYPKLK